MKTGSLIGGCLSLLFLPAMGVAQHEQAVQRLDKHLESLVKAEKFMGGVAVSVDGQIVFQKNYGNARFKPRPVAAAPDTRYRIGSCTKTVTAVLFLQLVEEGLVKLETPLSQFFPEVPNAEKITMKHLLQHQSGLHNYTEDADHGTWRTRAMTREQMLKVFASQKPDFEPGAKSEYSNPNYVLLGYIIEKLTGKTYDEVLQERIVQPAGMTATSLGQQDQLGDNEADCLGFTGGQFRLGKPSHLSIPHGAGAIISTPADMTRFLDALFGGKLLKPLQMAQMTRIERGFGLGIQQARFQGKVIYQHGGTIDGFRSSINYLPEAKLSLVVTANALSIDRNQLMLGLLQAWHGSMRP